MTFKLKSPCVRCPFLKDSPTPLHPERLPSIVEDLDKGAIFYCHKTIDYQSQVDEEGENFCRNGKNQFCAGALIFLEKQNRPNQAMRMAERLGLYDHKQLKNHPLVIDDLSERKISD